MLKRVAFAVAAGCLLGPSVLTVVSLLAPERRLWPAADDDRKRRVYQYTRNPQNVGYVLLFAACAVLANSPLVGVLAVAFAVFTVFQVLAEEALRDTQGDAYEAYCERVPRFIRIRTFTRALDGGD